MQWFTVQVSTTLLTTQKYNTIIMNDISPTTQSVICLVTLLYWWFVKVNTRSVTWLSRLCHNCNVSGNNFNSHFCHIYEILKNIMIGTNSLVETSFTSYFILYQVPYVLGEVALWNGQLLNLYRLWPVHWINIPVSKHVISDDTNEKSEKKTCIFHYITTFKPLSKCYQFPHNITS